MSFHVENPFITVRGGNRCVPRCGASLVCATQIILIDANKQDIQAFTSSERVCHYCGRRGHVRNYCPMLPESGGSYKQIPSQSDNSSINPEKISADSEGGKATGNPTGHIVPGGLIGQLNTAAPPGPTQQCAPRAHCDSNEPRNSCVP